ncbi:hypothetical protein [uncultured Nostoc sp.]|uniref:hypothetical protein n=1 Tax=uncultured Nostoc sp. TaxID=340711 RepID=UPI002608F8E2|nr:hypothetical protein [uncultured Nostoc sp.]
MATPDGKRSQNAYGTMRFEEIGARLITFLKNWVMSRKLGHITGFSVGFILPSIEEDNSEKETCDA